MIEGRKIIWLKIHYISFVSAEHYYLYETIIIDISILYASGNSPQYFCNLEWLKHSPSSNHIYRWFDICIHSVCYCIYTHSRVLSCVDSNTYWSNHQFIFLFTSLKFNVLGSSCISLCPDTTQNHDHHHQQNQPNNTWMNYLH